MTPALSGGWSKDAQSLIRLLLSLATIIRALCEAELTSSSMNSLQQCLRPPLRIVRSRSAAATAFYRRINNIAKVLEGTQAYANYDTPKAADASRTRTEALLTSGRDLYPRFPPNAAVKTMQHKAFRVAFDHLTPGQTVADTDLYLQGVST